jgi:hypothetical protein
MSRADPALVVDPVIDAYKRDIDRTLVRESLTLSVEARLERLIALQELAEELRRDRLDRR